MMSIDAVVFASLARHLDRDAATLRRSLRLDEDLDVTPLELVLIVLEVEESEGVELPVEQLATVNTVGELLSFCARAVRTVAADVA